MTEKAILKFKDPEKVTPKKGFQYLILTKNMGILIAQLSGTSNLLYGRSGYVDKTVVKFILCLDKKFADQCFFTSEKMPEPKVKIIGLTRIGKFNLYRMVNDKFYCQMSNKWVKKTEIIKWHNIPESSL